MAALQMKWSAKQQTRQASSLPSRYNSDPMRELLNQIVAYRSGALVVLSVAALLEALGDSCFQSGLYRSSGMVRAIWLAGGALALDHLIHKARVSPNLGTHAAIEESERSRL